VVKDGNEVLLLEKRSNRFMSRPANSFVIDDDNEASNTHFIITATDRPRTYRLMDKTTGRYLTSIYGSLRLSAADASNKQLWTFWLQADGTYKIENVDGQVCLTISGSAPFANTPIYLAKKADNLMQSFSVCFDSRQYPDKAEAKMFTTDYLDHVAEEKARQEAEAMAISEIQCSPGEGHQAPIYDLQGRRMVPGKLLPKGIFISNGKKIMIR